MLLTATKGDGAPWRRGRRRRVGAWPGVDGRGCCFRQNVAAGRLGCTGGIDERGGGGGSRERAAVDGNEWQRDSVEALAAAASEGAAGIGGRRLMGKATGGGGAS